MKYDVIIIGGGLGGLTAGAKLAIEGRHILLLEQHDRPGGCATTFTRKGFTMEVGLHEMDGLHPADGKTKIFNELGVSDGVEFLELPDFFRFHNGRTDFLMPHDKEEAIAKLKEHFPDQSEGIDTYFERLANAMRINVMERRNPDISVGEYLDSIFTDEELKLVLLGNLGYFHDDPYSLALRYFAIAEGAYFNGRANYIKGGSQKLSDRLVEIIRENGGKVLLNHKVTDITVKDDKVSGLTFINVQPGEHSPIIASADEYILNAALPLAAELMGGANGALLKKQLESQKIGASLLTVYFGFSKSLKDLGYNYYSTFVYDESVKSQKDILQNNHADFDVRSFTFVDYSQVDSGIAPEGKSVGAICCIDYTEDWVGLSRSEYKEKKKEVEQLFAKRLDALIPGCREYMEH
nr:FAD-dependent oxidoreductase [Bacteroidales bacterium]